MSDEKINTKKKIAANNINFHRNIFKFLLFALPTVYISIICAVVIHEVLGHGLVAHLLGSEFQGFVILLDGMGWAYIDLAGLSTSELTLVFLGGSFFTTLFSIFFYLIGIKSSRSYFTSIALLFLAYAFLMDGIPYYFWDALYMGGIGDASQILHMHNSGWIRALIIILSGAVGLLGMITFNYYMYTKTIRAFYISAHPIYQKITAFILFLLQFVAWISFDWAQLVPNIQGNLPTLVSLLLTAIILIYLSTSKKIKMMVDDQNVSTETKPLFWTKALLVTWTFCIVVFITILLFLQTGVTL